MRLIRTIITLIAAIGILGAVAGAEPSIHRIAKGFGWPEGPFIDADGAIVLVNLTSNYLNKVTTNGAVSILMDMRAVNNGVIPDGRGNLYFATTKLKLIQKLDARGMLTTVAAVCDGDSLLGPNDFAWDRSGRLYFTDPYRGTSNKNDLVSGVHYIEPDGTVKRFAGGLRAPNGIAFSRDFSSLFIGDTGVSRVWQYEVRPDGSAGERHLFYDLGEGVLPDGMKVDIEGNLWIAVFTANALWCISPAGERIHTITLPNGAGPTNLVFGGPDMKTVWVTVHEKDDETIAIPGQGGALYEIRNMPIAGLPLVPW